MAITETIKNDSSYKTAVQYIEKQDKITADIGEIGGFGYFPAGSINYTNGYGIADLKIKVKGKNKSIAVSVYLLKVPGKEWFVKDIKYQNDISIYSLLGL